MSQESIWEKSLNDEVDNQRSGVLIRKNFPYELNDITLRNYFNMHKLDEICTESIYDYFKDNMFKDFEGFYLPHLLCRVPYISYEKIYKALEEVFKVISPNIGTNNEHNMNYFQYYMTIWRKENLVFLQYFFKDIYSLGLKYDLDKNYCDTYGYTNLAYYFASAPLDEIFNNYKFFVKQKYINYSMFLEILGMRIVDLSGYSSSAETRLIKEKHEILKNIKLFSLINPFLSNTDMILYDKRNIRDEFKKYTEIKEYIRK